VVAAIVPLRTPAINGPNSVNATTPVQNELGLEPTELERVTDVVLMLLRPSRQPSAWELVEAVETKVDIRARWLLPIALKNLGSDSSLVQAQRAYCIGVIASDDLTAALCGREAPRNEITSTIDSLLRQSTVYRSSADLQNMLDFVARFREYAPFNNMLIRTQMPACGYYASEKDWLTRFGRKPIEDARPMLILAPMHPVMLVYDLDQTEGRPPPAHLTEFAQFVGEWDPTWLERLEQNALVRDKIAVSFKTLSSSCAGFATMARGEGGGKMRIAIHDGLDGPSRFGVLCHELAHIYLGHLGSDKDHWWPSRRELTHRTVEIEAESVAFVVTSRHGLTGASASYVSGHLGDKPIPQSVSLDLVAKVAGRIERMITEKMTARS
jgi:hypothetical protein